MPVCGYSMKYAEGAGLVKFDFLGLKTLTVIDKACALIRKTGVDINIETIALDDPKTFKMLSDGDSVGVFQLESAGMRDTLRKMKPDTIDDIIALISLYRPGPMDNIPSYIARKHGLEEPDYLDPMLEGVLKETYGVIIYQEQVMQIAQVMGGYSLGAADLLRRAMGKKIASEMDAQRKIFVDGAIANKVDKHKASSIFDLVAKFAGYGFNKSHAAAYALISYQTAYLKANYPVEFLAASMNLEIQDTDKINTFRQECISQGIDILSPDVNKSGAFFKPEKTADGKLAIRYGLGGLKGVGIAAMELLEKEAVKAPFKDIFDMAARLPASVLNKRQLESLIKAGAFDNMHKNRKEIFGGIEGILRYNSAVNETKNSAQVSLFGGDEHIEAAKPKLEQTTDWPALERMNNEFEAVGLYLNQHPISIYENILRKMRVFSFAQMNEKLSDGNSSIKVAGVMISKRMRSSPRGRFATLMFSDPTGIFEVSIFDEDVLSEARDLLEAGCVLLMDAEARKDSGGIRLTAHSVRNLQDAVLNYHIKIYINNINAIAALKNTIGEAVKGKTKVSVVVQNGVHQLEIALPESYNVSANALEDIRVIDGVKEVVEV
jgi:DNA polymerase-3 subunit alpha